MTVISEAKKRRTILGGVFGAISGAILTVGLYFFTGTFIYAFLIPVASLLGAGQMYMTADPEY